MGDSVIALGEEGPRGRGCWQWKESVSPDTKVVLTRGERLRGVGKGEKMGTSLIVSTIKIKFKKDRKEKESVSLLVQGQITHGFRYPVSLGEGRVCRRL